MIELAPFQKRHLRGLGHALSPVVLIGQAGLSEAVILKTQRELEAHELIKVRAIDTSPDRARDIAAELAERAEASLVQVIGHTVLLYKARAEEPTIVLPTQRTSKTAPLAKSVSTSSAGKGGAKR